MLAELFDILEANHTPRCVAFSDAPSGLRAFLVIDDLTLGPAAGGIRTKHYPSTRAALEDAMQLARTMTLKCSLAGLSAGGGKIVVMGHGKLDRAHAFERLGEFVEELNGMFYTAGDFGTTPADLAAVARKTKRVHLGEERLSQAVGRGLLRAIEACARLRGHENLVGLRIAVQGCGVIGSAAAHALHAAGAHVIVADTDASRAQHLARKFGCEVVAADAILTLPADIISPCAIGGVLTAHVAEQIRAWAVCGAANNILGEAQAETILVQREILVVPDFIASAGGVIDGVCGFMNQYEKRDALLERIFSTTINVLQEAQKGGRLPSAVAEEHARQRIAAVRQQRNTAI